MRRTDFRLNGFVTAFAILFAMFTTCGIAAAQTPANSALLPPPTNPQTIPTTQQAQPGHVAAPGAPEPTVKLKPGELPAIEFDTPIYDFGRIKTGKDVEHDFWFHNTGNGPLEILQVKPS